MDGLRASLVSLGVTASTGRVVDFRLKMSRWPDYANWFSARRPRAREISLAVHRQNGPCGPSARSTAAGASAATRAHVGCRECMRT